MDYSERLYVPLRWWVLGTLLIATFWLAMVAAVPEPLAWAITALMLALLAAGFLAYGTRITVSQGDLRVGKAHIGGQYLGDATTLDKDATKRVAGVEADARAHLVLRPYLKRSVRVAVADPEDPTPYWLISTRNPDALVAALQKITTNRPTDRSAR